MSIDAATIQILLDGAMGGAEILTVAKAMERGPDRDFVFALIHQMEGVACPRPAMAIAILEVAGKIIAANTQGCSWGYRDEHTARRDSNKARRRISNQKWQDLRQVTFERDGWACVYCGSDTDLTCDHVVPLVRGGTNEMENLATACRPCNSSKGHKLLDEWRAV